MTRRKKRKKKQTRMATAKLFALNANAKIQLVSVRQYFYVISNT